MKELFFEGLFSEKGDYGADLKRTVTISVPSTPANPSFIVPEDPVASLKLQYKGVKYRILLYSLS